MVYLKLFLALIIALTITLIGTPFFIRFVQKKNGGQSIREEGPVSHFAKTGTPTMGGLVMIFAVFVTLVALGAINKETSVILLGFLGFGILGFMDDFVKIYKKRNLGLTAKQKIVLQVLLATGLALYQWRQSAYGTDLIIPFLNRTVDLGAYYVPFVVFVIIAMVNSVNLTDGLDGLASGITMFVACFFAMASILLNALPVGVFSAAIIGACIGFLFYNRFPAKIFMGDTGSMALGGGLAIIAITMNLELFLPIVGGMYVLEALSVVLQVLYFKLSKGKRLFKMSPIHHHFELSGWKEPQIVTSFWAITLVLCSIAYLGL